MNRIEEINQKHNRVKELLERLHVKGILLKTQANFCWFTAGGLNEVTIADTLGVSSILVTRDHRYIISNRIESARMMEDEGLQDLQFTLVEYEWYKGSEYEAVKSIINPNEIVCDVSGYGYTSQPEEINVLRYQLMEPEIERYLWLGQKASQAVEAALYMAKPGMSECMVTAEVLRKLWYDRIDSVCNQAAADERSRKYRHAIATEKRIDKYLMLNVNARKWGLVTTITRCVYFGSISDDLRKQYEDNTIIECEMIEATKVGVPVQEVLKKSTELYEQKGYFDEWKQHHQGGAQGYRNREYLVYPDSKQRVLENQCFCWNPSIAGKNYGTKSEDAFIVTKNGPLMVTNPVSFPSMNITVGLIEFNRPKILEIK